MTTKKEEQIKHFYRGRKIMVTGGTGFIGSFLVVRLVELGAKITIVARPQSDLWRLKDVLSKLEMARVDLVDFDTLRALVLEKKPQLIFNFAGLIESSQSLDRTDELLKTNTLALSNFLQSAESAKVDKFVQIGTILEYGAQHAPFLESCVPIPISGYSLSKTLASELTMFYGRTTNLKTVVLRPAATFGPKQTFGMLIPNLIRACILKQDFNMNPGGQKRDLIYVEDLVDAFLAAGAKEKTNGQIINLGSGQGYKIKQVANEVNNLMGNPIKIKFGAEAYRPFDIMTFFMNSNKAKKLLGWKQQTKLAVALKKTISWYNKNYHFLDKLKKTNN